MAVAFFFRGLRLVADVAARRNWRLAKFSNFLRGKYAQLSIQADGRRSGRDGVGRTDGPGSGREQRSPADERAFVKLLYAATPESPLHVHPSPVSVCFPRCWSRFGSQDSEPPPLATVLRSCLPLLISWGWCADRLGVVC
jgi:hypothetical protein